MKARVDAGTDAATIAAWDASRNDLPLGGEAAADVLEADAAEGHVCVLETGADGGGQIDVYVDEEIPREVAATLREVPGRFLLSVPSGRLIVGGGEDYRSVQPAQTSDQSIVVVPAGDYEARWFAPNDPEREPSSEAVLHERLGKGEVAYYDRVNNLGCAGGFATLLLFPILVVPFGWAIALAATIIAFLAYFPVRQLLLRRNERYQRLDKVIPAFRLATEDPYLVLELRRVQTRVGLKGGTAKL